MSLGAEKQKRVQSPFFVCSFSEENIRSLWYLVVEIDGEFDCRCYTVDAIVDQKMFDLGGGRFNFVLWFFFRSHGVDSDSLFTKFHNKESVPQAVSIQT